MTWQAFTIEIAGVLAWPITVLAVAWLSRPTLTAFHERVQRDLKDGQAMKINGPGGTGLELAQRDDYEGVWRSLPPEPDDAALPDRKL